MTGPTHTTLIPVYNGAQFIAATLKSVLGQRINGHRVIVSDDASTDNTLEIVRSFQGQGDLHVVQQPRNLGMVENWNVLLAMVDTPTFTLISQDDLLRDADVLPRAIGLLTEDPSAAAVFSDVQLIDGQGRKLKRIRFERPHVFDGRTIIRATLVSCRNSFGLPLAIRSGTARGLRYDPRVRYAADVEFAASLAMRNPRFLHIAEPLFEYRVHLSSATRSVQHHSASDFQIIAKNSGITLNWSERMRQRINLIVVPRLRLAALMATALREGLMPPSVRS